MTSGVPYDEDNFFSTLPTTPLYKHMCLHSHSHFFVSYNTYYFKPNLLFPSLRKEKEN